MFVPDAKILLHPRTTICSIWTNIILKILIVSILNIIYVDIGPKRLVWRCKLTYLYKK